MSIWWIMSFAVLLTPLLLIAFGRMLYSNTPQNINNFFGYRTQRSMKNLETWDFANKYIGKLWFKCGMAIIVPSLIPMCLVYGKDTDVVNLVGMILIVTQTLLIIVTIPITEKALKNKFGK